MHYVLKLLSKLLMFEQNVFSIEFKNRLLILNPVNTINDKRQENVSCSQPS